MGLGRGWGRGRLTQHLADSGNGGGGAGGANPSLCAQGAPVNSMGPPPLHAPQQLEVPLAARGQGLRRVLPRHLRRYVPRRFLRNGSIQIYQWSPYGAHPHRACRELPHGCECLVFTGFSLRTTRPSESPWETLRATIQFPLNSRRAEYNTRGSDRTGCPDHLTPEPAESEPSNPIYREIEMKAK